MADMTVIGMPRTVLMKEEFGKVVGEVDAIENFLPYRSLEIPPNTLCMYYDWKGTRRSATGRVSTDAWEWTCDLYIHGYEPEDVELRMEEAMIGLGVELEKNPKLNRAASLPVEMENMGPVRPIAGEDGGFRGLLKRFRLIVQAEQAV